MDIAGIIIILVGFWGLSFPFVEWYAIKNKKKALAILYTIPIWWQAIGYLVVVLGIAEASPT